jgi:rhodanese-related sulfurtransferase
MQLTTTETPLYQEFHINGINHISPAHAFEAISDGHAILLDVREPAEVSMGRIDIDEIVYHPLSEIMERLALIPRDKFIIVACPGGVRSSKVVNLLNLQGFPQVANLDGGLALWQSTGLPFLNLMVAHNHLGNSQENDNPSCSGCHTGSCC